MKTIKSTLKSKTFWGALGFALIELAKSKQLIAEDVASLLSTMMIGLGLYGARNTKRS